MVGVGRILSALCGITLGISEVGGVVIDIPSPQQAHWTQVVLAHEGGATVRATTRNAAFHETFEWRVEFILPATTAPGTTTDTVAAIYDLQTFDPAVDGGVDRIDVSFDVRRAASTFANGVSGFLRPVVMQAGEVYSVSGSDLVVDSSTVTAATWSLAATDNWVRPDGTGGLDLSPQGGPLKFGFRWGLATTCNGVNGCNGGSTATTLDNLRFEIHPVPEPASLALLISGGLALTRRRRGA